MNNPKQKREGFSPLAKQRPVQQQKKFPKQHKKLAPELVRRFKIVYPEYFGFNADSRIVFEKTLRGYRAHIGDKEYIGMPAGVIENPNNTHLFMEV